jgi:hypothetical protein
MTKKDLIEKLKELKIEHDPRLTKDELFELLPSEEPNEELKVGLYNKWGQHVRDYALKSHGENYREIAEAEAEKMEGYIN